MKERIRQLILNVLPAAQVALKVRIAQNLVLMIHQILKMCFWAPVYVFKCKSNFCDGQEHFAPGLEAYI